MKASDLEERIEIWERTVDRVGGGAGNESYTLKCSTRARVNYASGNRTVDNQEIFYDVNRTFFVRYYVPVVETDEIRWKGQRWQILSIDKNREYNDIIIQTSLINV